MNTFNTPILFLIFNRPKHTQAVFEAIKLQKPKTLFIAADGPRENRPQELENCNLSRKIVLDRIDWDCEVKLLFRDNNLGCGKAVHQAINWFFDHVEEGIILEDDCLPGSSFFTFCEELLIKYRDTDKVMHINGSRFLNKANYGNKSYYFSNYFHPYGWATWRRAWEKYDYEIPVVPSSQFNKSLGQKFPAILERDRWQYEFSKIARHEIDTWDTQWYYSIYKSDGIGITPVVNLVSNIGFDEEATHTHDFVNGIACLPINEINTLSHPNRIIASKSADRYTYANYYAAKMKRFDKIKFMTGKIFPFIKKAYLVIKKLKGQIRLL